MSRGLFGRLVWKNSRGRHVKLIARPIGRRKATKSRRLGFDHDPNERGSRLAKARTSWSRIIFSASYYCAKHKSVKCLGRPPQRNVPHSLRLPVVCCWTLIPLVLYAPCVGSDCARVHARVQSFSSALWSIESRSTRAKNEKLILPFSYANMTEIMKLSTFWQSLEFDDII